MKCKACGDWGLKLVVYKDHSTVHAVCLCPVGERWRMVTTVNGKTAPALWRIWAFQHGVDPAKVLMLEDAVTPEELSALGFSELVPADSMDAIAAAARAHKVSR